MFKTIEELKEFILWAKSEKIARIKVADVEVEMSNIALIPQAYASVLSSQTEKSQENQSSASEDEELLMWSSRP